MTPLDSPKKLWQAMTAADRVLSAAILALSIAWGVGAHGSDQGAVAVVQLGNEEWARVPLDRDAFIPLQGRSGPIDLEVHGGAIAVVRSNCPNHVCTSMGWKRATGDVLACVPNGLVVRIEGGTPPAHPPDAVAR
ncbi:MAG TPA: NusG domain II-containing protein [bacterium]|nr:NusG domain II-containing protein [bacterium]